MPKHSLYRGCIRDLALLTGVHRTIISKVVNGSRAFTPAQRKKMIKTLPCPEQSPFNNLTDAQLIKLWHEIGKVQRMYSLPQQRRSKHG